MVGLVISCSVMDEVGRVNHESSNEVPLMMMGTLVPVQIVNSSYKGGQKSGIDTAGKPRGQK